MDGERENLVQACRTCLSLSDTAFLISQTTVDNVKTLEMLNYFSIEIKEDNDLPKSICYTCLLQLQGAYKFITACKKNQDILDQELFEKQLEHIVIVEKDYEHELESLERTDLNLDFFDKTEEEEVEESIIIEYESSDKEAPPQREENFLESSNQSSDDFEIVHSAKIVSNSYNMPCPLCPAIFTGMRLLRSHLNKHSETIQCKFCCMQFEDADSYLRHYKTKHKYVCQICDKAFPRCDTFTRHMQAHTNNLPRYECPAENCTKIFGGKQSLQSHYSTIHSESRDYLCNYCGAAFKNYDNLRYHIKKHKGPSHVCAYCGKAFMISAHLNDHMWRHTGVKPFKCGICDKSFLAKKRLIEHVEKKCAKLQLQ